MKKYFLFIAIFTVILIVMFSCRKSFEPDVNPNQMTSSSNETELKIQSFLDRMHSNLKDETTYSIEDAIWYSTAVLNYTYAIYDSSFIFLSRDTSNFNIELGKDGKICESILESTINLMVDSLEAVYEDLPANIKHLVSCRVYEIDSIEGNLNVGMVSAIGWGYSSIYYGTFGITDWWRSMWNAGKCNGYSGEGDATLQLEYKLMNPLVQNDPDWRVYTIPEEEYITDYIYPDSYPYTPSPRGHRGFVFSGSGDWEGPQCLSPDELNFYISANGMPYIIEDNKPSEEFDFTEIDVEGDVAFPSGGFYETHYYIITYAPVYHTIVPASGL